MAPLVRLDVRHTLSRNAKRPAVNDEDGGVTAPSKPQDVQDAPIALDSEEEEDEDEHGQNQDATEASSSSDGSDAEEPMTIYTYGLKRRNRLVLSQGFAPEPEVDDDPHICSLCNNPHCYKQSSALGSYRTTTMKAR